MSVFAESKDQATITLADHFIEKVYVKGRPSVLVSVELDPDTKDYIFDFEGFNMPEDPQYAQSVVLGILSEAGDRLHEDFHASYPDAVECM